VRRELERILTRLLYLLSRCGWLQRILFSWFCLLYRWEGGTPLWCLVKTICERYIDNLKLSIKRCNPYHQEGEAIVTYKRPNTWIIDTSETKRCMVTHPHMIIVDMNCISQNLTFCSFYFLFCWRTSTYIPYLLFVFKSQEYQKN
jgi:hypothetical protein